MEQVKPTMELKNVYRGNEIKFANLFRSAAPAMLREFSQAHPNFQTRDNFNSVPYHQNPTGKNSTLYNKFNAWKVTAIKHPKTGLLVSNRDKYPTAFELTEAFGNECVAAFYSVLDADSIIYRHTDAELNRDAKCIRVHIPLYIPPGDVGAEVEGEIINWDDIWAFNNQKLHGAWNHTNQRRLVYLIDLHRKFCGIPMASAWFPGCNDGVPKFEKTQGPSC